MPMRNAQQTHYKNTLETNIAQSNIAELNGAYRALNMTDRLSKTLIVEKKDMRAMSVCLLLNRIT